MQRRNFFKSITAASITMAVSPKLLANESNETSINKKNNDRKYWSKLAYKIVNPVFTNLANETLVKNMPEGKSPTYDSRKNVTYLEAFGRAAAGVAPWLALPDDDTKEGVLRKDLKTKFLKAVKNGVNPSSPDYLNFTKGTQPIVDAAYLAHAFLRAPKTLWEPLEDETKQRVIKEFKALRTRKPWDNNWLLFRAITESFLLSVGAEWDKGSVFYAIEKFKEWYVGDGWYSDGANFSFDYYNSYVMHPMLVDTLEIMVKYNYVSKKDYDLALKRMIRFSNHLERMISPEGTYPVIGRSITYRTAAFQVLAQVALMEKLPKHLALGGVRAALTAVKKNILVDEVFDKDGWLRLGFCGYQPEIADYYTSTGSLYMTSLSFLPLGLPEGHQFWTSESDDWTAKKAYKQMTFHKDYHVSY